MLTGGPWHGEAGGGPPGSGDCCVIGLSTFNFLQLIPSLKQAQDICIYIYVYLAVADQVLPLGADRAEAAAWRPGRGPRSLRVRVLSQRSGRRPPAHSVSPLPHLADVELSRGTSLASET